MFRPTLWYKMYIDTWIYAHIVEQGFKNLNFVLYFLNKDISVNIQQNILRFEIHKHEGHSEEKCFKFLI